MGKKHRLKKAIKAEHSRYLLVRTVAIQQGQKMVQLETEITALRQKVTELEAALAVNHE